jgi:uncharacterized protein YwqG
LTTILHKDEFIRQLHEANLSTVAQKLEPHFLPSIRVLTEAVEQEDDNPIGASKMGGRPDVPADFEWPQEYNVSMTFIVQFNLQETAPFDQFGELPSRGFLYFFKVEECIISDSLYKVIFLDSDLSQLHRANFPENLPEDDGSWCKYRLEAHRIKFAEEMTFPPYEQKRRFAEIGFTKDEADNLWEFLHSGESRHMPYEPKHRLLGYHDCFSNDDMQFECALNAHQVRWDILKEDYTLDKDDPRWSEIERECTRWRLLLQVDTDMDFPMMWGDAGTIFFWIRDDDLAKGVFDSVYLDSFSA